MFACGQVFHKIGRTKADAAYDVAGYRADFFDNFGRSGTIGKQPYVASLDWLNVSCS